MYYLLHKVRDIINGFQKFSFKGIFKEATKNKHVDTVIVIGLFSGLYITGIIHKNINLKSQKLKIEN